MLRAFRLISADSSVSSKDLNYTVIKYFILIIILNYLNGNLVELFQEKTVLTDVVKVSDDCTFTFVKHLCVRVCMRVCACVCSRRKDLQEHFDFYGEILFYI